MTRQDTPLFGSFCFLKGFVISVPCLPSHHNAWRGNHCHILPLRHLLPPGNLRDHGIPEISANGMGSPLYRLAALPKISLAQLLLLSSQKTPGCQSGRKWGKDVGRGETYEGEKRLSLTDWTKVLGFPNAGSIRTQDLSSEPALMLRYAKRSTSPVQRHSFSLERAADNRFIGLRNMIRIRYDSFIPQRV